MDLRRRIKHAWNAFMGRDSTEKEFADLGPSYASSPITSQLRSYSDRSIINSIFNMIARDVASIDFVHAKVDKDGHYVETLDTPLEECLSVEANLDQTGPALIQDAVGRMLRKGVVAIVPFECSRNPDDTGTYDIYGVRCADIIAWYPKHIKVRIYNENDGQFYDKIVLKENAAIIQNPMYDIMNEPNSILQKIYKKLALLDVIDNESASTKLNMIIQMPYNTRSTMKQDYAQKRIDEVEDQLANSPRGIAYMDVNEKLIQLNKPLENNLLEHVKYLMDTYKQQLGVNDELLSNTFNEVTYNNYSMRIIEPICVAFCTEMKRKWLTKTARTQGQSITFFRDQFRNIPTSEIAKIADVLSRNEIMSSNELRQKMGLKPSDDPRANELNNANMPSEPGEAPMYVDTPEEQTEEQSQIQNEQTPELEPPQAQENTSFSLFNDESDGSFTLFK